jgi:hypothetical protein
MERALQNYIEELKSDISAMVYSEGEGASFEDKYTEYCIEVFESIGKSEGARVLSYVHPNSQGGIDWKINGYCLKDLFKDDDKNEYFETLDLFITNYKIDSYENNITKEDYSKSINQIKKFINSALKRHIDYIDPSNNELNELIKIIGKQGDKFDRINVYFLINGFSNHKIEKIDLANVDIFVHTWDILRLFKINESKSSNEPIEIEFEKFIDNGKCLQCLKVPSIDQMYDCYLVIVPGEILSKLYKEFSNELLESNVRAFLGQAGKFNKGIRDTIRNNPQMFLPYNNGITATAERVETKFIDNQLVISKLFDFQIVNGGQTTASIYHTKKKFKDTDLSKIFVQMKLTVIKDPEQKNIEVPKISRFANSQNKVDEADFSSNNLFLIKIENLSRKKYVVNPENKNQAFLWFFERVKGQYKEILNKKTFSQQKQFREQNPQSLRISKADVAKYINSWDLEPYIVAQGSQKSFNHYIKKTNESIRKNNLPGDNYYRKLIGNAILFKTADKLFGRKGVDAIEDTTYKALVIGYTISYLHFLTNNRLDLWKIYEDQKTDHNLNLVVKKMLIFVFKKLFPKYTPEALKGKTPWEALKGTAYSESIIDSLDNYLISEEEKLQRENEKEIDSSSQEDSIFIISEIQKMGLKFWDGFKIYIEKNSLEGFEWTSSFEICSKIQKGKNLNTKDIMYGKKVLEYFKDKSSLLEEVKSQSNIIENEITELKFIYDKLLLISKDEWTRIIDLASQTKIFDKLELDNVKSIQNLLAKKGIIKEQSLIKGYSSLKKLKKFGIII